MVLRLRSSEFLLHDIDVLFFRVVLGVAIKLELHFFSLSAFFGELSADTRKTVHFLIIFEARIYVPNLKGF